MFDFIILLILFVVFACWGSFLNVVAYRLIHGISIIFIPSVCPHCKTAIAWYDLIPLISWLILHGSCRTCKKPISYLYPCIEIISACLFTALSILMPADYFSAYFIFFSALIVTIRSDIEYMLISRMVTLYLVPVAFIFAWYNWLPISLYISIIGALGGYLFLYGIAYLFWLITKKEGMGQGDFDLLALIGAFTGPVGCWMSILIGSIFGSCIGIALMFIRGSYESIKIPFGPFLALGAIAYIFMTRLYFA